MCVYSCGMMCTITEFVERSQNTMLWMIFDLADRRGVKGDIWYGRLNNNFCLLLFSQIESDEKTQVIEKLGREVQLLKEELNAHLHVHADSDVTLHHNNFTSSVDMLHQQSSSRTSPNLARPSSYVDLNNLDDSVSLHHSEEPTSDLCSSQDLLPEKHQQQKQQHTVEEEGLESGKGSVTSAKWSAKNGHSNQTKT